MRIVYERENLRITEFDTEDVITTSGVDPTEPATQPTEKENAYGGFSEFDGPGNWF